MASIPVFRAGSGVGAAANSNQVTVTIPSTVQAGDVMILVACLKLFVGSGVINTPTGWTQLAAPQNGPTGNTFQGAVYMKVADAGDAGSTLTVTAGASQQFNVALAAYDLAGTSVRGISWDTGSTTAATAISHLTPSTGPLTGDLVIVVGAARSSTTGAQPTFTGGTGITVRGQSINVSGSAQNVGAYIGDDSDTSGAKSVTASSAVWTIAGQVVLKAENVTLPRSISETATLVSAVTALVTRPRPIGEAASLADSLDRGTSRVRSIAEVPAVSDATTRARSGTRAASETATLANATTYTRAQGVAVPAAIAAADSVTRGAAQPRGAAGAVALGDSVFNGRLVNTATPEALVLAGVSVAGSGQGRTAAEGAAFDAVAQQTVMVVRYATESVELTDDVLSGRYSAVSTDEAVTLEEVVERAAENGRAAPQDVAIAAAVARVVLRDRSTGETAAVADTTLWQRPSIPLTTAEEIAVSAATTRGVSRVRSWGESLAVAETTGRRIDRVRAVAELVTAVEAATLNRIRYIDAAVALVITGQLQQTASWRRGVLEELAVSAELFMFGGDGPPTVLLVAYPHRVTMTSSPARIHDTTASAGVRRTV